MRSLPALFIFLFTSLILLTLLETNAVAQERSNACLIAFKNTISKDEIRVIPKEVCIASGYYIIGLKDSIDFDNDGLKDFFCERARSHEFVNGDTIYLDVYKQYQKGRFSFFKSFSNLEPIYFKLYTPGYYKTLNDPKLKMIAHDYCCIYPLVEYNFTPGFFKIQIETAIGEGTILNFRFERSKANWILVKKQYWYRAPDGNSIQITDFKDVGRSIRLDEFKFGNFKYETP